MELFMKLFLVYLITGCQGQSMECWTKRNDKVAMRKAMQETMCGGPRETLIRIPVPDGYDKAYPGAVIAKRCTGLVCTRLDQECVPSGDVTNKTLRVEAIAMNGPMKKKCFDFEYFEHNACKCGCDKTQDDCRQNQVFNKERCSCDCPKELKSKCLRRMKDMPNMVMWDEASCSCPCNNWRDCGSGEMWASDVCRCVPVNLNNIDG